MKPIVAIFLLLFCAACAHGKKEIKPKAARPAQDKDPYFAVARSNLKAFEGDYEGSLKDLKGSLEAFPEDAYLQYLAAERYAQIQDFEKANQAIDKALQLKPDWFAARLLKAGILQAQGEFEKGGEIFQALSKEKPEEENLHFQLAQNFIHQQKYGQAIAVLRAWLAKNPESTTALYFIATIQNAYLQRPQEAIKTYEKLLLLEPDDMRVRSQMAQIYLKLGNNRKALEALTAIEHQFPKDLSIKLQIASLYQEQGEIDRAIAKLKEILALNPEADRIHYFLGLLHEKKKEFPEALRHLEQVSGSSGVYKEAVLQQVAILKDLKREEEAIGLLKGAIRKNPKIPQFYLFLSLLWEEEKKMDAAVGVLKEGLQKNPKDEEIYFNLGVLYDKQGQKEKSIQTMHKVLEINPKNPSALNYIGYTYAEEGKNLDEALKLITEALELKPGDGYITDSLGWVYYRRGDLKKALFYLEKAYKTLPKETVIVEHMGDVYLKMGQKRRAIKFFQEAHELGKRKEKPNPEEIKRVEGKLEALKK